MDGLPRTRKRGGPGSKSRQGCITCKTRRVKCDETPGACMRCKTMHLKCEGYVIKMRTEHGTFRPLLPLIAKGPLATSGVPNMLKVPGANLFNNAAEFRYFEVFRNTVASDLAQDLDSTLWNTIVLQSSEQEPFIRHAVIALGALNQSFEAANYNVECQQKHEDYDAAHYQTAFRQHGKSIKGLREACATQPQSRRTILIACLLAVCFEYLNGNVETAITHIESGLKLVDEWMASVFHLASLGHQNQNWLTGIVEDELLCVFTRLEIDVFAWHKRELVTMNPFVEEVAMTIIRSISSEGFSNVASASKHFDVLLRQVDVFVVFVDRYLWSSVNAHSHSGEANTGMKRHHATRPSRLAPLKKGLVDWLEAFQPLAKSIKSAGKSCSVSEALFLRHLCSSIAIECCYASELSYDSFLPQFQEAFSKAEALLHATTYKPKLTFVLWSVVVRSVFFIALKCREQVLRRKAIASLHLMTRREGLWDARVAGVIAQKILELEEGQGCHKPHIVPEWQRLRAIKTSFDLHKRQGRLKYLVMKAGAKGSHHEFGVVDFSWTE